MGALRGQKNFYKFKKKYPVLNDEMDRFVRRAYKGGYVLVDEAMKGKDETNVSVFDVNSMFPWAMRYCRLPYGLPIRREKPKPGELYVVEFQAIFELKEGMLPTVQLKNSIRYVQAEYLTSSHGDLLSLSMTNLDYELFKEHYDVIYEQGHQYFCFNSEQSTPEHEGPYDKYIDFWMTEKEKAVTAGDERKKEKAKRFLNSLYGKRGENPNRMAKVPHLEDDVVKWDSVETVGNGDYLPHAVFITAWARDKIIRTAQKFHDAKDFIYCDTDSIHCLNGSQHLDWIDVHPSRLGAWKLESTCEKARYVGPKKYVHVNEKDDHGKMTPFEVKCAGMPIDAKQFVTWENFHLEAVYDGKLTGKTV